MRFLFTPLFLSACCALFFVGQVRANTNDFLADKQVQSFITRMVKQHGFDKAYVEGLFARAEKNQKVLDSIRKPAEGGKLTWQKYRDIFIVKKRIDKGKELLHTYRVQLAELERRYGVPKEILVAVVGVETLYGTYTGKYKVFNSLATIAFNYPRRHKFFASELEHFLLLCRKYNLQPFSLYGSYAGAMGLPQFMPSSYLKHARSYTGEAAPDIWRNTEDALTSVAHYLHHFGWKSGLPPLLNATVNKKGRQKLAKHGNKIKATVPYSQVRKRGWKVRSPHLMVTAQTPVTPLALKETNRRQFWLGSKNLYVISRYNPSLYYTLVVSLLAEQLATH